MSEAKPVAEQARAVVGGLVEVVCVPVLQELAPKLWPVLLLVDESGHGKGLPLNRRAGELYGAATAGDALICQERRFWVPELSGFTARAPCRLPRLRTRSGAAAAAAARGPDARS